MLYRDGAGVERDHARAVELLRQAAEQGMAFAQLSLGELYQVLAEEWFSRAAAAGNRAAQLRLESLRASAAR